MPLRSSQSRRLTAPRLIASTALALMTLIAAIRAAGATSADDLAYLESLGLIRGHLIAGTDLYRQGDPMAVTHMKHPDDELYADLEPRLEARGVEGFSAELEALAAAVENGASQAEVNKAHARLAAAIARAEAAAPEGAKVRLLTAARLIRVAGEEYDAAFTAGRLSAAHEYQDAYGFTRVAWRRLAAMPASLRAEAPREVALAERVLRGLDAAFEGIAAPARVETDPALFERAADALEALGRSL